MSRKSQSVLLRSQTVAGWWVSIHVEHNMRFTKHDQEHESQYVSEQEDQRLYPSGEVLRVCHNDIHFFAWKLEA